MLAGLTWSSPTSGGVSLHHAKLYAVSGDYPDGPVTCDGMPAQAVAIHVWGVGGAPL